MRIMQDTMKRFDEWYGPYPYKQITVVDPGDIRAGGMEYPMLFTGDITWWMPDGLRLVEQVVEHEFGHQYWYGMVATNEFEDAWLDEGINSYTECKILDDILGKDKSAMDLWHITESDISSQRNGYLSAPDFDPMTRYRFTHPTKEDFLKTVEEVSGQNLRWFYDQAVYGTNVLDYEIFRARSDRLDWYLEAAGGRERQDHVSHHGSRTSQRRFRLSR